MAQSITITESNHLTDQKAGLNPGFCVPYSTGALKQSTIFADPIGYLALLLEVPGSSL